MQLISETCWQDLTHMHKSDTFALTFPLSAVTIDALMSVNLFYCVYFHIVLQLWLFLFLFSVFPCITSVTSGTVSFFSMRLSDNNVITSPVNNTLWLLPLHARPRVICKGQGHWAWNHVFKVQMQKWFIDKNNHHHDQYCRVHVVCV